MPSTERQTNRYTIDQIQRNVENSTKPYPSRYWFTPDTLRFFGSRVQPQTYGPDEANRTLFITTERSGFQQSSPRKATVRFYDPETDTIGDIGEFCGHSSIPTARTALRKYLRKMQDNADKLRADGIDPDTMSADDILAAYE